LRLGDLLRLSWSHLDDDEIVITTGKSTHRREAIIPLYDNLRAVPSPHPEAIDYYPHEQQAPPLDPRWFRLVLQQGEDCRWHESRGFALSRSARHGGDKVLHRRPIRARDRWHYGMGGGSRCQNHSSLR
jgi:hypothetical protein